jgi:predicted RNase H-like HicB family nuclease
MKIKVIIHQAEEGGYWAEVPANENYFWGTKKGDRLFF